MVTRRMSGLTRGGSGPAVTSTTVELSRAVATAAVATIAVRTTARACFIVLDQRERHRQSTRRVAYACSSAGTSPILLTRQAVAKFVCTLADSLADLSVVS